jgi:hypothetical protein
MQPENQFDERVEITASADEAPAELMDAARRAVRAAVREHKLLGNPIAAWRDGKVVLIPPEEIDI